MTAKLLNGEDSAVVTAIAALKNELAIVATFLHKY
jgi:hypothetical protein